MTPATRPSIRRTLRVVAWLLLAIAAAPLLLATSVAAQATDAVEIKDQPLGSGNTVTVPRVLAAKAGWIVIHLDQGGQPGTVLGQTAVKQGENANIVVNLSQGAQPNTAMWAMLHIDAGTIGTYEFPGPDAPVVLNQQTVMTKFQISSGTATSASPSASTSASASASPTTMLPETGGAALPLELGLLLAALVVIVGVFVTRRGERI